MFPNDAVSIEGDIIVGRKAKVSLYRQPCLKCLGFIRDKDLDEEVRRYGEAGGNPQVIWSNGVLASTAVGIFIQLLRFS